MRLMKVITTATIYLVGVSGLTATPVSQARTISETTANSNATIITAAQCKANEAALKAGTNMPYVDELRTFSQIPSYMTDGVVQYVVEENFPYRKELDQAVADWNAALGGKITLKEVTQPSDRTISVGYEPRPNFIGVGEASPTNRWLKVYISTYLYPTSIRQTLAHEFGHIMGLGHGCSGTVMAVKGQRMTSPTDMDIQAVLQGRDF